jgi:hypothetical protein
VSSPFTILPFGQQPIKIKLRPNTIFARPRATKAAKPTVKNTKIVGNLLTTITAVNDVKKGAEFYSKLASTVDNKQGLFV